MSMKNPLIPAGIEPATFRIVAQHLNDCANATATPELRDSTANDLRGGTGNGTGNSVLFEHTFHIYSLTKIQARFNTLITMVIQ